MSYCTQLHGCRPADMVIINCKKNYSTTTKTTATKTTTTTTTKTATTTTKTAATLSHPDSRLLSPASYSNRAVAWILCLSSFFFYLLPPANDIVY